MGHRAAHVWPITRLAHELGEGPVVASSPLTGHEGAIDMATLLVSYDLKAPGRDYDELYKLLKSTGTYSHPLESVWLVVTPLTTVQYRDALAKVVDANDRLLVIDVSGDSAAWRNFSEATSKWLKKHLK